MREKSWVKKSGVLLSSLVFVAALGVGCATDQQVRKSEEAMKEAQASAAKAEAAAARAEAAAEKCERTFEKGLRK